MGPTITGQPSDYTGVVGGTATMKVTANGSGLKYQWYVSKDSGKSWNSLGKSSYLWNVLYSDYIFNKTRLNPDISMEEIRCYKL